jgi:3-hydroxybutyryl-CoA dehydrogenase
MASDMVHAKDHMPTVAVVGTGIMGRGIAQLAAQAGMTTRLYDAKDGAAAEGRDSIAQVLHRLAEKGRVSRADADAAIARMTVAATLDDLKTFDIVVEAIVENLDVKRQLFQALEARVADDCVLASNTSSLSVTAIAAGLRRPERVAGFHFFNPAPLMKIVEVVAGARTDARTLETLIEVTRRMGHRPVRVKDMPGFLINHAGRGYVTEALRIVSEGVAAPVDVDRIMRDAAGFRMGPFELLDLTGLDVSHPVMESIYHQFYEEPRFRPSAETARRLAAGLLGRKTSEGFYRYAQGQSESLAEEPAPDARPSSVFISSMEVDARRELLAFLQALPDPPAIENNGTPSADALCIVTPFGSDATTTCVEQGLDATRTVAVDPVFSFAGRITVMATPLTSARRRAEAHGLLASGGAAVTAIADSPGFVAQRILAAIANIGCDIAQQRIADPSDIDDAVRLGLGYPHGPLAIGDRIGAWRVLRILERLQQITGDPRYRPSLWLRRRALLAVPLATPDLAD